MEHKTHSEETRSQAREAADRTRAQAADTVRTAVQSSDSFIDNQKRLAAAEVDGYACALHEAARQLHDQAQDRAADYTERFAKGLDRFATELRERKFRDNLDRFADFARRQPMLFVGGAVAAGFVVTRFLKSSADGRDEPGLKEKLASGVEKAKETAGDVAQEMREKVAEAKEKPRDEKHAKKRGPETRPHTAAEVEVPVILKPHEPEPPTGPAPKP